MFEFGCEPDDLGGSPVHDASEFSTLPELFEIGHDELAAAGIPGSIDPELHIDTSTIPAPDDREEESYFPAENNPVAETPYALGEISTLEVAASSEDDFLQEAANTDGEEVLVPIIVDTDTSPVLAMEGEVADADESPTQAEKELNKIEISSATDPEEVVVPPEPPPQTEAKPDSESTDTPVEKMEPIEDRANKVVGVIDRFTNAYLEGDRLEVDKYGFFVPAPSSHILPALRAAEAQPGEKFADLGSGDGRWPAVAGGVLEMEAYGFESSPERHAMAVAALQATVQEGVLTPQEATNVHLANEDFMSTDISDVDVFVVFQPEGIVPPLQQKIANEAKNGARLILYTFHPEGVGGVLRPLVDPIPEIFGPCAVYRVTREEEES